MTPFFYKFRRQVGIVLIAISVALAALFLLVSNQLVQELSAEERSKAGVWANATTLFSSGEELSSSTVDLIFSVLQSNKTIPVIVLDSEGKLLLHSNMSGVALSDSLPLPEWQLERMKRNLPIEIHLDDRERQYLYYGDSLLLKKLSYYPYIQLGIMLVFLLIVYMAIVSAKRAEQNQVWVGLTKETAHQLGTPISSLMAWVELLKMKQVEESIVVEIDKDVKRLERVADRFSKIGSKPELVVEDLSTLLRGVVGYMGRRTSSKIVVQCITPSEPVMAMVSASLFEWVIENLCKNAVDAIQREGAITVELKVEASRILIEVTDSGKGMNKSMFEQVFTPGFTTKRRGWGLGLTLARRIVEEYHAGKIYVKSSELNQGTTFRIELPLLG